MPGAEAVRFGVLIGTTDRLLSLLTDKEMASLVEGNNPRIFFGGGGVPLYLTPTS